MHHHSLKSYLRSHPSHCIVTIQHMFVTRFRTPKLLCSNISIRIFYVLNHLCEYRGSRKFPPTSTPPTSLLHNRGCILSFLVHYALLCMSFLTPQRHSCGTSHVPTCRVDAAPCWPPHGVGPAARSHVSPPKTLRSARGAPRPACGVQVL